MGFNSSFATKQIKAIMKDLEFKGSKGEWSVYSHDAGLLIHNDKDLSIAHVYDYNNKEKHNAQLIAAAPELLEACLTILKGYESDGMENMYNRDEVFYSECKKAINKALGL